MWNLSLLSLLPLLQLTNRQANVSKTTKDKYVRHAYCDNGYLPIDWTPSECENMQWTMRDCINWQLLYKRVTHPSLQPTTLRVTFSGFPVGWWTVACPPPTRSSPDQFPVASPADTSGDRWGLLVQRSRATGRFLPTSHRDAPPANDLPPIGHRRVTHRTRTTHSLADAQICIDTADGGSHELCSRKSSQWQAVDLRLTSPVHHSLAAEHWMSDDQTVGIRRHQWSIVLVVPTDNHCLVRQLADTGDDAGTRLLATLHKQHGNEVL